MTVAGIVLVDVAAILVLAWILNLTRLGRLYVGYAAVFAVAILATLVTLSWAPLRALADRSARALFPDAGIMVAFLFVIGLLLVYVLAQLTIIANRLSTLVQELAIQQAGDRAGNAGGGGLPDGEGATAESAARRSEPSNGAG